MMSLGALLQAAYLGKLQIRQVNSELLDYKVMLFRAELDPVLALMAVMEIKNADMRETAIWRSALMRTSSRPVDMVFSIMGLFDVRLDPSRYGDDERERATVDLARAIMKNGKGASWLLASLGGSFLSTMCTMPSFPETSVTGMAEFVTPNGPKRPWQIIGNRIDWAISPTPKGEVDHYGRLVITGKLAPVTIDQSVLSNKDPVWRGFDREVFLNYSGKSTTFADFSGLHEVTHAIVLGEVHQFSLPATAARANRRATALMLLHHKSECWNRAGIAVVDPDFTKSWGLENICIGRINSV